MANNLFRINNGLNLGSLTGDPANPKEGDFYRNSTTNRLRAYINGSWRDAVMADEAQTLTNKTIDADNNTVSNIDDGNIKAAAGIDASKIADGSVSNAEFQALNGLVGAIVTTTGTQTLTNKTIDADLNTISNIENADIKAAAAIDATKIANGSVDNTEFQRLDGVNAPIVTTTGTQTLSNKTLQTSTTQFSDTGNTAIKIAASGPVSLTSLTFAPTAPGSYVVNVPAGNVDLVGHDTTQTLTNKTISGASNTLSNIPNSATTATALNTASTIVARDGAGGFAAEDIVSHSITVEPGVGGGILADSAGAYGVLEGAGANNITVGGASSTVVIPGNVQINGTTVNVNTTDLNVTDKNISVNVGGNDASSEGAGLTVDRTSTDGSLIYKAASASKWAAGPVGSEDDLVAATVTQTLTNKTVGDALTMVQVATPSNPAAGRDKLYFKSDDKLYRLTSAGVEAEVGSTDFANKSLSNLTAPTAINEDLEFAMSDAKIIGYLGGGSLSLETQTPLAGLNSGDINLTTGTPSTIAGPGTADSAGTVNIQTGIGGEVTLGTPGPGARVAGHGGSLNVLTGNGGDATGPSSTAGNAGSVSVGTGDGGTASSGTGVAGNIDLWTGNSGTNGGGYIYLQGGQPTTGGVAQLVAGPGDPPGSATISGGSVISTANTDAGSVVLQTGQATGNGGGTIEFQTVPYNQGSGVTVRGQQKSVSIRGEELRLHPTDDPTDYVGLKAPTSTTSYTVSLPNVAPTTGQVLQASSATALTWANSSLASGDGVQQNLLGLNSSFVLATPTDRDAESSVGNWIAYADAAGTSPVDMTGGSPTATAISRNTVSPLNGTGNFVLSTSFVGSVQGEGVSCVVHVPPAYRGTVLEFGFAYTATGTFVEDDFRLFAYDVTNSTVITPYSAGKILGAGPSKASAIFPIPTNCAQLRVGIHIAAATGVGAPTISFDDVYVTPHVSSYGMAGSDVISFTPTGSHTTNISYAGRYWRVGDNLVMDVVATLSGATDSGSIYFNLPSGLAIDTTKLASTSQSGLVFGTGVFNDASGSQYVLIARYDTTTRLRLLYLDASAIVNTFSNTAPVTMASGDTISMRLQVPIATWSSNVTMANSSQFRISSYLANGTNTAGTAPARLGEYTTKRRDPGASTYNTTTATPGTLPSAANGFLIYRGVGWASGDAVNQPTRYDIFIGQRKSYRLVAYTGTGFTGPVDISPGIVATANGIGYSTNYDESTGVLTIVGFNNANLTSAPSTGIDATGNVITSNLYMDVIVSENALAVGVQSPRSEIQVTTGAGHGSTNTKIRRIETAHTSIGSAISVAHSATLGTSFTINEDGVYSIRYRDDLNGGVATIGISRNSTQLTTTITSITAGDILDAADTPSANRGMVCVWVGVLRAGDVIRPHTDGTPDDTSVQSRFQITKVSN
jgi:hypothetical protein